MKLTKFNKEFPYRDLSEILSLDDIIEIFNDSITYRSDSYREINNRLAKFFYNKYKWRYPFEQDKDTLKLNILTLKDTYIDTFYSNVMRTFGNEDLSKEDFKNLMLKGNILKYKTVGGNSASPYNISFNNPSEVNDEDFLYDKSLSETSQENSYQDVAKRTSDIMYSKINGEIMNFINSFYSLFTNLDLTEYIETELDKALTDNKEIINYCISLYEIVLEKLEQMKKGENNER